MAFRKRSSSTLDKSDKRAAGLKAISSSLDLGNGLTLENFIEAVNSLRNLLEEYNTHLSKADELSNRVDTAERLCADLSERMLNGVAAKFGKDSNEYEQAGGIRKSERIAKRKTPAPAKA